MRPLLVNLLVLIGYVVGMATGQVDTTLERPPISIEALLKQGDCSPKMCTRMYMPICAQVGDEHLTAPSMCDYNNKVRCAKILRRSGYKIPEITFLHNGECKDEEEPLKQQQVLRTTTTARPRRKFRTTTPRPRIRPKPKPKRKQRYWRKNKNRDWRFYVPKHF